MTERAEPTAVSALAAEVEADQQGRGLSRVIIQAMAAAGRGAGLSPLIAPVRPSWKDRYPLIPIAAYAAWRRADGLPFDPWMRVHVRLGGTVLRPEPQSMQISAPVADWEEWTGLLLPAPGQYVFPGGLAPLTVADGIGDYWEPNVWLLHPSAKPARQRPAAQNGDCEPSIAIKDPAWQAKNRRSGRRTMDPR